MDEGGFVNYDARPGDVITLHGKNRRARYTTPSHCVLTDDTGLTRDLRLSWDDLLKAGAFYVARLIPCDPPEGETKI